MAQVEHHSMVGGEFRVVVKRADGSVRVDTGFQKNLVLDNGLRFLLDMNQYRNTGELHNSKTSSMMTGLVVGSGNTPPNAEEVKLANYEGFTSASTRLKSDLELPSESLHPNFIRVYTTHRFLFNGLGGKNISELGLVSYHTTSSNVPTYLLNTRALIKDSSGRPITISVLQDEILEVDYTLNLYVDTRIKQGEFTVTEFAAGETASTHAGTTKTYQYAYRPSISNPSHVEYKAMFDKGSSGYWNYISSYTDKTTNIQADFDITEPLNNDELLVGRFVTFGSKLGSYKDSGTDTHSVSGSSYHVISLQDSNWEAKTNTYKFVLGNYTHNHERGIRGFSLGFGLNNSSDLLRLAVVVKEKTTGATLKKTDRQRWEFTASYSVGRWEG